MLRGIGGNVRPIEELKNMKNLCVQGRVTRYGMDKFHVYEGFVEWSGFKASVIFGYDESGLMEHVSVSPFKRRQIPTWEEMCKVKQIFFRENEMVVEIHPSEERYVHGVGSPGGKPLENVLHLWRPMNGDFSILNHPEKWD